jgi:hypothetical protein
MSTCFNNHSSIFTVFQITFRLSLPGVFLILSTFATASLILLCFFLRFPLTVSASASASVSFPPTVFIPSPLPFPPPSVSLFDAASVSASATVSSSISASAPRYYSSAAAASVSASASALLPPSSSILLQYPLPSDSHSASDLVFISVPENKPKTLVFNH